MKKRFTKIIASALAVLTFLFTFCFTSFASEKICAAELQVDGKSYYYDDAADAWNALVGNKRSAKMILHADWTADENGNMGTGKGFKDGAIYIGRRDNKTVIDLNGHTIDRSLAEGRKNGCVFIFYFSFKIVITDSSKEKTGKITGGNNIGIGGAIYSMGAEFTLENITISGNTCTDRGGAIFATYDEYSSDVKINKCIITENKANKGGAIFVDLICSLRIYDTVITKNVAKYDAGVRVEVVCIDVAYITLGGKVIIADNVAEKEGTGLTLGESFFRKAYVRYDKNRPLDKESRIVVLSNTDDKTLRITDDSSEHYSECYEYENDSYTIVKKGSGNDKYLDIKKN